MRRAVLTYVAAAAVVVLNACGGSSNTSPNPNPSSTPVPAPSPTPTPTPDFKSQCGDPVPPPLYGMKLSVQVDQGSRKLIDSKPVVENTGRGSQADSYCFKVGFDFRVAYCDTRPEGNAQREACDALVVGRATDTGRIGPTWSKDGKPCDMGGNGSSSPCSNHPDNQFLAISRGDGQMLACASDEWPATGARCAGCNVTSASPVCLP
jgi:hypothetical protein